MQTCPIPEVDRALSTYIHNRQEALKIRRALTKHLYSNFRPSEFPPQDQHLRHLCPQGISKPRSDTGISEGLRKEYMNALQQNLLARENQKKQHALLQNLRYNDGLETSTQADSTYDVDTVRDYVTLLRERRRFAELQIIHDSLEKILDSDPTIHHRDPREIVLEAIGDQPGLPAEQLERRPKAQNENGWTHKLKKEVLLTKSSMDQANSEKLNAKEKYGHITDLSKQVYALGRARDDIVSWVEEELLKLNEESEFIEDMSPRKIDSSENAAATASQSPSESDIRQGYRQYTTSRTHVIEAHGSISSDRIRTSDEKSSEISTGGSVEPTRQNQPVTDILPHIPHLLQISNEEKRMLQHSVYLQNKLASTDGELRDALSKLSEESHLLPSGSQSLVAWARAALDAEKATGDIVNSQLNQIIQHLATLSPVISTASLRMQLLALSQSRM